MPAGHTLGSAGSSYQPVVVDAALISGYNKAKP
jgi:hypothetical protein